METFLQFLAEQRIARISAQMVTFDDRRGFALLERYGFQVLNRFEITKFKEFTNQTVYLSTILREVPQGESSSITSLFGDILPS